jgi:serine/threonine protein kinase
LYDQNTVTDIAPFVYATDLSANGTFLKKSNSECTGSQGRGILMGKNGTFLLDDGDELQLSESVTLIYQSIGEVKHCALTKTQQREKNLLSSRYLLTGRLLGEGGYGKVLIGIDQATQRQLACKVVDLERLYGQHPNLQVPTNAGQWSPSQEFRQLPDKFQKCFREIDIIKDISHPNIVHIQKVFWSRSTIYMFQDLVTGGDLFSYIDFKRGKLPAIESAVIIRQILLGVQYLHDHNIVHRDLKPDNILMTSLNSGARIVITDFGHARFLPNADTQHYLLGNKVKRMWSVVGTLEYTAPEVHRANKTIPRDWGYSLTVDMWSIGTITAALLTGQTFFSHRKVGAFEEDAQRVIVGLAAECDLSILDDEDHPSWGPIAPAPKDFVKRLLVLDENDRMSASQALDHIWFTHPMMAREYEAQYERSIKDWHPLRKDNQLVEHISTIQMTPVASQMSNDEPFARASSHFLPHNQESYHDDFEDTHQPAEHSQFFDQHASQPEPISHENSHARNEATSFDEEYDQSIVADRCDADYDWDSGRQRTNTKHVSCAESMHQTIGSRISRQGQLQSVSTSTRGEYFQREIIDLDDVEGGAEELHDTTNAVEMSPFNKGTAQSQRRCTIQVRTTPSPDIEASGGVEQWWPHRYPPTQYHYDTQAEPMTQDDDFVVVPETPPESVDEASKPTLTHMDASDCAYKHSLEDQRLREAPIGQKANKKKKVYGRRR